MDQPNDNQSFETSMPSEELVKGLAKFREQLEQPEKSREVNTGKYTYRYATLNDVINAIDHAIKGTGLSYLQFQSVDNRMVKVRTIIVSAGDRLDTGVVEMAAGGNPQAVGSAITYARRYSLSTAFGIAPDEDDDGRAAENSFDQVQQRGNQNYQNNRNNAQSSSQERTYPQQRQQAPSQQSQNQAPQQQQAPLKSTDHPAQPESIKKFQDRVDTWAKQQGTDAKAVMGILFSAGNVKFQSWKDCTVGQLFELNMQMQKLEGGNQ
ncbi:ERF family protein [Lacticaseibacillus manihotivorans]|uniref:Essential recombination function protein n=2 Tax=Lacticaseibacillus manihotivorans TaxID=88233 RepID=A0A0R1QKL8_9LACO|nr:ERF family protein [Lacticaseibacillus manihotivorans]KRL45097.1 hypothetical protein FD01_GL000887 [Lacticaseibacillus manihotivorans DSM 13343 = JCM 12514]QFQ90986.1 hypothetical protein LM010_05910 [Lacticaseibacillus manihotivorans]